MSDLISRKDAIEAITNYAKFLWDNFHEPCNLTGMIDAIEALPTIDPVKHGRWVLENGCVRCSECGEPNMEWNYCPNCGADMRGEEDD